MALNIAQQPDQAEWPAAVQASLEELFLRVSNENAKRELWKNRFTAADREKFTGTAEKVLKTHSIVALWHVARCTPTANECLVEVAYALGFINPSRRENLLSELGSTILKSRSANDCSTDIPQWDEEARELRYRGKVVRTVRRPKQARSIVTILQEFEAAGWPRRIDDPIQHRSSDESRRRDVYSLNTGLDTSTIKFACDGNRTGITWAPIQGEQLAKTKK